MDISLRMKFSHSHVPSAQSKSISLKTHPDNSETFHSHWVPSTPKVTSSSCNGPPKSIANIIYINRWATSGVYSHTYMCMLVHYLLSLTAKHAWTPLEHVGANNYYLCSHCSESQDLHLCQHETTPILLALLQPCHQH